MGSHNERTQRRKLHKKRKRKPYRQCSKCGRERVTLRLVSVMGNMDRDVVGWRLFKVCNVLKHAHNGPAGCGHTEELFRAGGGTADTYPGPARDVSGTAE